MELDRRFLEPVAGFGTGDRYVYLNQTSLWSPLDILALIAILVVVPALAFALIAARTGSECRDRRLAMLHALGASRSARAWVVLGEAARPVALGAVSGGLVAALSTLVDIRLIFTDYVVSSHDLAGARWAIIPIAVAVFTFVVSATVVSHARLRIRHGATSPRLVHGKLRAWPQFGLVIGGTFAAWGTANHGVGGRVAFLIGMALVLICLPLTASWLAGMLGGVVARLGRRFSAPGLLVGGRWLSARPAILARVASVFVIALTLASQVQVVRTIITDAQGVSLTWKQQVGTQIVTVFGRDADRTGQALWTAIGRERRLVMVDQESDDGFITHTLIGSCETLARLGQLPVCPDKPVPFDSAIKAASSPGTAVRALYTVHGQQLMLASEQGEPARVQRHVIINDSGEAGYAHIRKTAFAVMAAPVIDVPGQGWLGSVSRAKEDVNWLLSFGLITLLMLSCIGALATADIFVTQCRELGMLSTYRSDRRLYLSIAVWNLTLPMLLATGIGSVASILLGRMLVALESSGTFSISFLATASAITLAFA
ncbi:MAG TPA: hypothetical protein VFM24_03750, partial [Nitrospira sp.]|nr:hypothetical protein [Nitrospira sp.]